MKREIKKVLAIGLVLVMIIAMGAGCANKPATADSSPSNSETSSGANAPDASASPSASGSAAEAVKPKLGLSMASTSNLFYSKMVESVEARCKEIGLEVVVTDENNDVSKQISSLENFISMKCTAIILVAFDPEGIEGAVKQAVDKGIFVMAYDGFVDGAQGSINLDNYEYGYATGSLAADWINANPELKAQDVIEAGIFDYPDIALIIDRAKGISDALTEKAPNVKIVAQQKAGIGDEGNVQAENFLTAHPNIQVICGINDTGCLGAYEVFTSEGHIGDNIGLFGADGDDKALDLIAEGTIYRGTVITGAFEAFPVAVDMCLAASQGNPPTTEAANILYPVHNVNIDNVQDYLNK